MGEKALVLAVNRAFHGVEAAFYAEHHPEIYAEKERRRWQRMLAPAETLFSRGPLRALDMGVGAGFASLMVLQRLAGGSELVCVDLSSEMLRHAREATSGSRPDVKKTFICSPVEDLALEAGSVDLVVVNSVLHHLYDAEGQLAAFERWLRVGGRILISHEPNIAHANDPVVRTFRRAYSSARRALRLPGQLARRVVGGGSTDSRGMSAFQDAVAERLVDDGVFTPDTLPPWREISRLCDWQSATAAGGLDRDRGFDVGRLASGPLSGCRLVASDTYDFLGKESPGAAGRLLEAALHAMRPRSGSLFMSHWEKSAEPRAEGEGPSS
jgi:ubiquinone/menaquinone biosynthesis C-methylase UbiE